MTSFRADERDGECSPIKDLNEYLPLHRKDMPADRDYDLFPQWNLDDHKAQTAFGQALQRYKGRILGGIRMETDEHDKKRIRYRFTLVGGMSRPGKDPSGNQKCVPWLPWEPQVQSETEGGCPRARGNRYPRLPRFPFLGGLSPCSVSQNGLQLSSVLQQVNTLAGSQFIPVPLLVAHNRHPCHQESCPTNLGRVLQLQFHLRTDLPTWR